MDFELGSPCHGRMRGATPMLWVCTSGAGWWYFNCWFQCMTLGWLMIDLSIKSQIIVEVFRKSDHICKSQIRRFGVPRVYDGLWLSHARAHQVHAAERCRIWLPSCQWPDSTPPQPFMSRTEPVWNPKKFFRFARSISGQRCPSWSWVVASMLLEFPVVWCLIMFDCSNMSKLVPPTRRLASTGFSWHGASMRTTRRPDSIATSGEWVGLSSCSLFSFPRMTF